MSGGGYLVSAGWRASAACGKSLSPAFIAFPPFRPGLLLAHGNRDPRPDRGDDKTAEVTRCKPYWLHRSKVRQTPKSPRVAEAPASARAGPAWFPGPGQPVFLVMRAIPLISQTAKVLLKLPGDTRTVRAILLEADER